MKYLVFAVLADGCNVATHSREYECAGNPEDEKENIITSITESGLGHLCLYEVFVFKSAQNFGYAPEQVAYWNLDDFDDSEDEEDSFETG